jgi:hypothetical protein
MEQMPVTCAIAEYREQRFEISFSTNEWVQTPSPAASHAVSQGVTSRGRRRRNPRSKA